MILYSLVCCICVYGGKSGHFFITSFCVQPLFLNFSHLYALLFVVSVGYEYESCASLILWEKRTAVLQGYELDPTNLGGWSLDKHHILNTRSGTNTHNLTFPHKWAQTFPVFSYVPVYIKSVLHLMVYSIIHLTKLCFVWFTWNCQVPLFTCQWGFSQKELVLSHLVWLPHPLMPVLLSNHVHRPISSSSYLNRGRGLGVVGGGSFPETDSGSLWWWAKGSHSCCIIWCFYLHANWLHLCAF